MSVTFWTIVSRSSVDATTAPTSPSFSVFAACSRAAARRRDRSVMSRAIFEAPTMSPVSFADRRDGERDRQSSAVLALPNRLVVVDRLAGADLGEDHVLFVLQLVGNQHADRLPDRLGRRVAEHPLGRRIPRRDDAVQILGDDRVVGRFDDRREPASSPRRPALRSLMSRAIFDAPMTRPASSRIGDTVSEIGMQRAVLPLADRLEVRDRLARADARQDDVFFGLAVRRDDHPNRPADGFGRRVAEHPLGGPVPGRDDAVQILADDRVVGRFDDGDQPVDWRGRPACVR